MCSTFLPDAAGRGLRRTAASRPVSVSSSIICIFARVIELQTIAKAMSAAGFLGHLSLHHGYM